jgi:precorrin-2 dehydrogenase/sirohydrochlorin ferrochelatase
VLPVALNCERMTAVIVGGGAIATRRAIGLHESGAGVRIIAPQVSAALRELAGRGDRLTIVLREYSGPPDIDDADMIIAATDVESVNLRVAADALALHRLVSVVNASGEGNFSSMAVHRAGQLAIGVTAGNVPRGATRIRDAIAERFDGRFAAALARCAEMRTSALAEERRDEWARLSDRLLGPDFCKRVEDGMFDEAAR